MKTYFVSLNIKSRFPKPQIGKFFRSSAHGGSYVWRRETTGDIARLAEMVNEAGDFLRKNANPLLLLQVLEDKSGAAETGDPMQAAPVLEMTVEKPRKLQRKPKEHPFD